MPCGWSPAWGTPASSVIGSRVELILHALGTLVERTSRYFVPVPLPEGRSATAVCDTMIDVVSEIPTMLRKSLTWDQGTEITAHAPYLQAVAEELNARPRRILGYRTPAEVFTELLTSEIASTG